MNNRKIIIGIILFSLTIAVYSQTAADFEVNGTVLVRYRGTERDVNIPASLGITEIGSNAFRQSNITSVTIPAGVTSIGDGAFSGLSSLSSINVHNRNTTYSSTDGVLLNKDKTILIRYPQGKQDPNYTIPRGVKEIGSNAFSSCRSLTSITLPAGLTTIGTSAFSGSSITSITIPESVTSIGDSAFPGSLSSINVHNRNTAYSSIDGVLFNKDKTILIRYPQGKQGQNYTIPRGVKEIGSYAFSYCRSLTSITLPTGLTTIGHGAFSSCHSLTSISIPAGVTSIGEWAFSSCESLTSITLPAGLTTIGDRTFNNCSSLTSIAIPESVTTIGPYAFSGSSLGSITIPAGIMSIAAEAFSFCENLTSINVHNQNTIYSSTDGVLFNKDKTILIQYPEGKREQNYTIPAGVTSIGDGAFSLSNLSSITIPAGVTSIGAGAFSGSNLSSITIPAGVTTIGDSAFSGCRSLTSITIPASVTNVGFQAFMECPELLPAVYADILRRFGGGVFSKF